MTNRILGLVAGIALLFATATKAEAYYWRPYHNNVIVNGYNLGWGVYGWPVTVGPVFYPTWPVFGNSYWAYYNYQPRYATYGAIAYSKTTGQVGVSWGMDSRKSAQEDAAGYCGEEDCKTVIWIQGGCGVLAKSEKTGQLAYAYYATKWDAQRYAMQACKRAGNDDCKPLSWVCSF